MPITQFDPLDYSIWIVQLKQNRHGKPQCGLQVINQTISRFNLYSLVVSDEIDQGLITYCVENGQPKSPLSSKYMFAAIGLQ